MVVDLCCAKVSPMTRLWCFVEGTSWVPLCSFSRLACGYGYRHWFRGSQKSKNPGCGATRSRLVVFVVFSQSLPHADVAPIPTLQQRVTVLSDGQSGVGIGAPLIPQLELKEMVNVHILQSAAGRWYVVGGRIYTLNDKSSILPSHMQLPVTSARISSCGTE